jgi:hypothetical protein
MHLLFAYHWLSKVEEDTWNRLGNHLGTLWDREALLALQSEVSGSGTPQNRIFVPLSLSINPELPDALLGKSKGRTTSPGEHGSPNKGDGLHTEMAMPEGAEVVNMGDLPKEEFFGLVASAGLTNTKK